ncbi:MAG TPA: hypothetical protein VIM63_18920, partial [Rhodoferax sp.]
MKRHIPIASPVCFAGRYLLPILLVLGFTVPAVAQINVVPEALSARATAPEATHAQQFTLANGMTLIVKPDRRAPTAVHMLW